MSNQINRQKSTFLKNFAAFSNCLLTEELCISSFLPEFAIASRNFSLSLLVPPIPYLPSQQIFWTTKGFAGRWAKRSTAAKSEEFFQITYFGNWGFRVGLAGGGSCISEPPFDGDDSSMLSTSFDAEDAFEVVGRYSDDFFSSGTPCSCAVAEFCTSITSGDSPETKFREEVFNNENRHLESCAMICRKPTCSDFQVGMENQGF